VISYPAKITYIKSDRSYLVEFPDLPGCLTEGGTLEQARANAREALSGYLASIFERNFKIPKASSPRGKGVYMIEPELEIAVPIFLRRMREINRLTQEDVARELGISYQTYQRLENPSKSNPTIKTLDKLAKVFHKELHLDFA
jgi:antitoxin HicB